MRTVAVGVLGVLALVAAGCTGAPAPVPVIGAPADLARLVGEWSGDYRDQDGGRSGNIVFRLSAGADTAFGDVVMIPRELRREHLPTQDPSAGLALPRALEVVSIAFVRALGGGVTGRLSRYRDPDCDCLVNTRFEGRIHGDTIEGTFTRTRVAGGMTQSGVWKVARKRS